jgi:hypothetical protein
MVLASVSKRAFLPSRRAWEIIFEVSFKVYNFHEFDQV